MEKTFLGREPWRLAGMEKGTPVLLALSGGADSCALLHDLTEMARRDGFSILLAHVNHGIRGEESLRDRAFCLSLAEKYGWEIVVLDADVPARAKESGRGLEEEARILRYEWFERLMRERNIPILATAHHADDQLETVLFRLARGTRLRGLCGIPPVRPFGTGVLVRPFLSVEKSEIVRYCRENGLEYVIDSTNSDTEYARNRIREAVTPVLDGLYPGISGRVSALCDRLREDEAYLASEASQWLSRSMSKRSLPVSAAAGKADAVVRRGIALFYRNTTGEEMEEIHLNAIMTALREGKSFQRTLCDGWIAVIERGNLRILSATSGRSDSFCLPFAEGETVFPASGIRATVETLSESTKVHNLSTAPYLIFDRGSDIIKGDLFWRSRAAGDRILQNGMHKRLRKQHNAFGVPARLRGQLPLLCDADGILWAPLVGCRDGLDGTGNTRILLTLPNDP